MPKSINRKLAEVLVPSTTALKESVLDDISAGVTPYATLDDLPTSNLTLGDQAFVTSNQRLYLSNGSGWYNVAMFNATPNLTISPSGAITLATDGSTPTIITLTGTDSDNADASLTYSVEADASFADIATLSQDSSVFTITPLSEGAATPGSSTLTFKVSDGISFGSGTTTFTLSFGPEIYDVNLSTGYRLGGFISNAEIDTWGAGVGNNEFVAGLGLSSNGNHLFVGVDRFFGGIGVEPMVTRYDMSTPYDWTSKTVNTGQTVTSWGGAETNFRGMHVSYDGYHIFFTMGNDGLHHFTMSTAWDLTSRSLTQKYNDDGVISKVNGYMAGFHMNHDGTKAYTVGTSSQGYITYLTLSTPWDLTTATLVSNYSPPSPFGATNNLRDIWLNGDGTQLIMCNSVYSSTSPENLASWDLTTPWDISTATNPVTWPNSQLPIGDAPYASIAEFEIWPQGGGGQGGNNGVIVWSPYATNKTYQVDIATVSVT